MVVHSVTNTTILWQEPNNEMDSCHHSVNPCNDNLVLRMKLESYSHSASAKQHRVLIRSLGSLQYYYPFYNKLFPN